MKEELLCYALLLKCGLLLIDKYSPKLDTLFLENPDDSLLLNLEFMSSDLNSAIQLISEEFYRTKIDKEAFGRVLLQELKEIYNQKNISTPVFGKRVYSLWNKLPNGLSMEEPFHILSYADDPCSWGDEQQSDKIYKDLFEFYTR